MNEMLSIVGRDEELLQGDILRHSDALNSAIKSRSFLVLEGADSTGQVVVREIFARKPKPLYVIDLSENNISSLKHLRRGRHPV